MCKTTIALVRLAGCETCRAIGGRAAATEQIGALVSRGEEPVLAGFELTPTAPLAEDVA